MLNLKTFAAILVVGLAMLALFAPVAQPAKAQQVPCNPAVQICT